MNEREKQLLSLALSYAFSNLDDINDLAEVESELADAEPGKKFEEKEVVALAQSLNLDWPKYQWFGPPI
jgi:hypothetical protein